jgi:phosphohistidine phosphatase SixA
MTPGHTTIWAGLGLLLVFASAQAADPTDLVTSIRSGSHVLMIRHAHAPGSGDPDHFKIGDCGTQRNLDDRGRAQAQQIGRWLRAHGITSARIFSSQWCRCRDTAEGLALGPVNELPALNSFFERPQDRAPNLAALRAFLSQQPTDGPLVVLVTHFVTISAISGLGVAAGEGVVLRLQGGGGFEVLGRLGFGL